MYSAYQNYVLKCALGIINNRERVIDHCKHLMQFTTQIVNSETRQACSRKKFYFYIANETYHGSECEN